LRQLKLDVKFKDIMKKQREAFLIDYPSKEEFECKEANDKIFMWAGYIQPGATQLFLHKEGQWFSRLIFVPWRYHTKQMPFIRYQVPEIKAEQKDFVSLFRIGSD
jgi:hypothetical protein